MARLERFLPCWLLAAGCVGVTTSYEYPEDLDHPNYVKRTKAAREWARRKDRSQIRRAFTLLDDEEGQIRALVYEALRSLMPGERDFGYRPYLPPEVRAGIVARWEAWYLRSRPEEGAGEHD